MFQDSHVYVCKRSVLDALELKARFDSIREEFIPWLCKPQYQKTRRQKYGQGTRSTHSPPAHLTHHSRSAVPAHRQRVTGDGPPPLHAPGPRALRRPHVPGR